MSLIQYSSYSKFNSGMIRSLILEPNSDFIKPLAFSKPLKESIDYGNKIERMIQDLHKKD
jgi:hypothetical protein